HPDAYVLLPVLERTAVTDADGRFRFTNLPASTVVVTIRSIGHRPVTQQVVLKAGREESLSVTLEPATVTLVPVVVTGAATASDPTTPLDVAAIDPDKLKAVTTASLGRTLERVPGVSTISTGPMAGNPVLRGMSQGQVRLTRDGVPVESFQGTSRWTPPISFGSVDRIEVIRGPASVLYGSSAMGGAINFLPKPLPRAESGGERLDALVESQYFSNNRERYGNAEVSGVVAGGLGFRAGASRRVADNFRTADAPSYGVTGRKGDPLYTGELPYSNYDQRAQYGQLGGSGAWGQLQLLYDGFEGFNNFLNANGKPAGVAMANHELRLRGTLLRGPVVLKPSLTRQLLRIQRAASAAKTFEEARATATWDQDLSRTVTTARLEAEHPAVRGVAGKLGVEYQYQRGLTHLSRIEPSSRTANVAVFAFEEYRLPRLTLSAGARYDTRQQDARIGSLVRALPAAEQERALHRTFSVVNGSLGAGVRLTSALTWTTSLNSGFRAPAVQDLYTDENRPAFGWLQGNPALKPERSLSVESALRYQGARASATITAYRNGVRDYIYMENTGQTRVVNGTTRIVYRNLQTDAVIRGVEAGSEVELLPRLVLEGSYSALRSENLTTGEALPLMPADQVRGSLRWSPKPLAMVKAPYVRLGARHSWAKRIAGRTEPFAEFDDNPAGFGISSTPAYSVIEAGLGGRVTLGTQALDVHLEVTNLFDTPYRDFLDTQKGFALAQGRNVSLRVSAPMTLVQ
ncbi:MAG TPA: TonB-dependent receptor, partial [Gemmatimonadaceae bacterium]|nr:TonB-dependent receptor [Gemmatimonadaceae bacterium]